MSSVLVDAKALLQDLWRGRWLAVSVAWALSLLCVVGVLLVRDRYEASARIYIDTQTVLKPLMKDLAFQPDIDQQVRMLARTLISRPNVERLRGSPEIGWEPGDPKRYSREIDELIAAIKVAPSSGNNIYAISYRDTDPDRARRLVESLVKTFVNSSGTDKRKDSEEARRFIDAQIRAHEEKLASAENALKDFKVKNFSVSGVPSQDFFLRISTLSDEVNKLRLELSAAEQSRDALKRELASEEPQLPPEALATGPAIATQSETEARLQTLKKQLDDLLRRYTDEHPDVVSTRRTIAQLEAQRRQELDVRNRAADGKTRVAAATNPVFQKIRFALAEAEANVASLRVRLGAQQARLDQARSLASRAPQAEAELVQLNRDYDVIRKNYELLVARRESAELGERIDESSPLVEFRIVDPPRTEPRPVFPSRVALAGIGALLALAGGIAAALAHARLHPIIDTPSRLRDISGRPVLGTVRLNVNQQLMRRERVNRLELAGAICGLLLLQAIWVGWILRGQVV